MIDLVRLHKKAHLRAETSYNFTECGSQPIEFLILTIYDKAMNRKWL